MRGRPDDRRAVARWPPCSIDAPRLAGARAPDRAPAGPGRVVIARDRELLVRAVRVNTELGRAVVELLYHTDGGELPAAGLRALGEHLAGLGADLLAGGRAGRARDRGLIGRFGTAAPCGGTAPVVQSLDDRQSIVPGVASHVTDWFVARPI
ncbi:MAG: hypothetical protein ACRDSE_19435 [Pseudonocardiaceae bacterium]